MHHQSVANLTDVVLLRGIESQGVSPFAVPNIADGVATATADAFERVATRCEAERVADGKIPAIFVNEKFSVGVDVVGIFGSHRPFAVLTHGGEIEAVIHRTLEKMDGLVLSEGLCVHLFLPNVEVAVPTARVPSPVLTDTPSYPWVGRITGRFGIEHEHRVSRCKHTASRISNGDVNGNGRVNGKYHGRNQIAEIVGFAMGNQRGVHARPDIVG